VVGETKKKIRTTSVRPKRETHLTPYENEQDDIQDISYSREIVETVLEEVPKRSLDHNADRSAYRENRSKLGSGTEPVSLLEESKEIVMFESDSK
jgi:hypothetical protein